MTRPLPSIAALRSSRTSSNFARFEYDTIGFGSAMGPSCDPASLARRKGAVMIEIKRWIAAVTVAALTAPAAAQAPWATIQFLLQARQRQQTAAFKAVYAQRAGVEGTISQAVAARGMRRSRYIGLAKTRLQHLLTAAAI